MKKFTCLVAAIVLCGGVAFGQGYSDSFILNTDAERINLAASGSTQSVIVASEPTVAQVPFMVAVSFGDAAGYGKVNKFGHNLATTTGEDVWGGGGTYGFYPTTGETVYAVSASTADDAAGTGVQSVVYYGLDDNWLEANEAVVTDGTTPVALTNTYVRMFRGTSGANGGSDANVGALTVTNASGIVSIYVAAGDGQTQHAIYTIPDGKSGVIIRWTVGISDGGNAASRESAKFSLLTRAYQGSWLIKGEPECINDGTTHYDADNRLPSGPLPARTDIRTKCSFASVSLGTVSTFDILLKDD